MYHAGGPCPRCGKTLDGAAIPSPDAERTLPRVGDLTMCFYCAEILVFKQVNPTWEYRVANDNERQIIMDDPVGASAHLLTRLWKAKREGRLTSEHSGNA